MKPGKSLIFLAFASFMFISCNDNEKREDDIEDVVEMDEDAFKDEEIDENVITVLDEDPELSTFSQNLERNELSDTWMDEQGPITIFVPTNTAYENLPEERRTSLNSIQDPQQNQAILYYLVVEGETTSDELRREIENANGEYTMNTMQGEPLTASLDGELIILTDASGNTATIVEVDRDAGDGIIHVIDNVLVPSDPSRNDAMQRQQADTTFTGDQM